MITKHKVITTRNWSEEKWIPEYEGLYKATDTGEIISVSRGFKFKYA